MQHLLKAIEFAATRHAGQTRQHAKGAAPLPYIVHPVGVASLLVDHTNVGEDVLVAAILHDVVEDTTTTIEEIEQVFGPTVAGVVAELTDPPGVTGREADASQLARAPTMSWSARLIKLADKTYNVRDLRLNPPGWKLASRLGYLGHCIEVVQAFGFSPGLRLLERFEAEAALTRAALDEEAALALPSRPC
jgi:guanosine-3',5'-bis(diphosphate) 3'-pyrophosphohydrolase